MISVYLLLDLGAILSDKRGTVSITALVSFGRTM